MVYLKEMNFEDAKVEWEFFQSCPAENGVDNEFSSEGMAHALYVALAVILRRENSCSRNRAEYKQHKYERKLVNYGNATDSLCSERTNHNVVKQVYKVRNTILNDHRNNDGKYHAVKVLCSYELVFEFFKQILCFFFNSFHISFPFL